MYHNKYLFNPSTIKLTRKEIKSSNQFQFHFSPNISAKYVFNVSFYIALPLKIPARGPVRKRFIVRYYHLRPNVVFETSNLSGRF